MRLAAFHVDDEADSAVFVFMLRIIETLRLWLDVCLFHICIKLSVLKCSIYAVASVLSDDFAFWPKSKGSEKVVIERGLSRENDTPRI